MPYPGGVLLNWAVSGNTEPGFAASASVCSSKAAGNRLTSGWPAGLSIGAPVRPVCCRSRKPLNFARLQKRGPLLTPLALRKNNWLAGRLGLDNIKSVAFGKWE